MEQIQNEMRETQGRKNAMGKRRAMELQMKAPQLMDDTQLEPTEPQPGVRGGGMDSRMARLVGRKGGRKPRMEVEEMSSDDEMKGGSNGRIVGGAKELGAAFMKQLEAIHGGAFLKGFQEGFVGSPAHMGRVRGKGGIGYAAQGADSTPGEGRMVLHARMSQPLTRMTAAGGENVVPGGMAPIAYGSAPQAPASFMRNTVGMGQAAKMGKMHRMPDGSMMPGATHGGAGLLGRPGHGVYKGAATGAAAPAGAGKRSARGAAVSRVMREKGMSLAEASRYIKEHGY
jgi:hypothetical protein